MINAINVEYETKGGTPKLSSGKESTVSINDSEETKKKYTSDQIHEYIQLYGKEKGTNEEIKKAWVETLKNTGSPGDELTADSLVGDDEQKNIIYNNPEKTDDTQMSSSSIEDTITDAESFMSKGEGTPLSEGSLGLFSKTISGIFGTIAVAAAVIMAGILGIKFMTGGIDEKAEVKQLIIPYIVGCIIVFGAFAIWKIAVNVLGNTL